MCIGIRENIFSRNGVVGQPMSINVCISKMQMTGMGRYGEMTNGSFASAKTISCHWPVYVRQFAMMNDHIVP